MKAQLSVRGLETGLAKETREAEAVLAQAEVWALEEVLNLTVQAQL